MSRDPRVSVVMPVYNAGRYIVDAINSILQQTFEDFEFIIIDDGSKDGTAAVLDAFAVKDSRIRLYRQANAGLVASLNRDGRFDAAGIAATRQSLLRVVKDRLEAHKWLALFPEIADEEIAVGPARKHDRFAQRNLTFEAARPRLLDGVIVEIGVATGLLGSVVVK